MFESRENQYLTIGYVERSHGVKGEVKILPEYIDRDLFDKYKLVFLENARGDLIPARIESFRIEEKNNQVMFFVKFDHITDRTAAERLRDQPVMIDSRQAEELDIKQPLSPLLNAEVEDEQGNFVGRVVEILENPAHPLLNVETEQREVLIPFVDEYIAEVDEENRTITVRNLKMLLDI